MQITGYSHNACLEAIPYFAVFFRFVTETMQTVQKGEEDLVEG